MGRASGGWTAGPSAQVVWPRVWRWKTAGVTGGPIETSCGCVVVAWGYMSYPPDNSHQTTPPWCTPHNSVHQPTSASRSSARTGWWRPLLSVAIGLTCPPLPPRSSSVCSVRVADCGCTRDTRWRSCKAATLRPPVDRLDCLMRASLRKSSALCARVLTPPWRPTRSGPESTGPPQPYWTPLCSSPWYWCWWDPKTPRIPTWCSGSPEALWKSCSSPAWIFGWNRAMCALSTLLNQYWGRIDPMIQPEKVVVVRSGVTTWRQCSSDTLTNTLLNRKAPHSS